jgi:hypothetical protein
MKPMSLSDITEEVLVEIVSHLRPARLKNRDACGGGACDCPFFEKELIGLAALSALSMTSRTFRRLVEPELYSQLIFNECAKTKTRPELLLRSIFERPPLANYLRSVVYEHEGREYIEMAPSFHIYVEGFVNSITSRKRELNNREIIQSFQEQRSDFMQMAVILSWATNIRHLELHSLDVNEDMGYRFLYRIMRGAQLRGMFNQYKRLQELSIGYYESEFDDEYDTSDESDEPSNFLEALQTLSRLRVLKVDSLNRKYCGDLNVALQFPCLQSLQLECCLLGMEELAQIVNTSPPLKRFEVEPSMESLNVLRPQALRKALLRHSKTLETLQVYTGLVSGYDRTPVEWFGDLFTFSSLISAKMSTSIFLGYPRGFPMVSEQNMPTDHRFGFHIVDWLPPSLRVLELDEDVGLANQVKENLKKQCSRLPKLRYIKWRGDCFQDCDHVMGICMEEESLDIDGPVFQL